MENQTRLNPVVEALERLIDNNELKIDLRILNNPSSPILALATLNMWPLTIKGFRLVKKAYQQDDSDHPIRLLPPSFSYKDKITNQTKYAPIFLLDSYSIWKKLEIRVIETYNKTKNNEQ